MQPYIDTSDRDFKLTKNGDVKMTFDIEEQNAVGICRTQTGTDMFNRDHGIDWDFNAKLGDSFDVKKVIAHDIQSKFQDEGIEVDQVIPIKASYPFFKFEVYYRGIENEERVSNININLL